MKQIWSKIARFMSVMVSAGDYEKYCAHRKKHHPNEPIMSRKEYFRSALNRKYSSGGMNRCC